MPLLFIYSFLVFQTVLESPVKIPSPGIFGVKNTLVIAVFLFEQFCGFPTAQQLLQPRHGRLRGAVRLFQKKSALTFKLLMSDRILTPELLPEKLRKQFVGYIVKKVRADEDLFVSAADITFRVIGAERSVDPPSPEADQLLAEHIDGAEGEQAQPVFKILHLQQAHILHSDLFYDLRAHQYRAAQKAVSLGQKAHEPLGLTAVFLAAGAVMPGHILVFLREP